MASVGWGLWYLPSIRIPRCRQSHVSRYHIWGTSHFPEVVEVLNGAIEHVPKSLSLFFRPFPHAGQTFEHCPKIIFELILESFLYFFADMLAKFFGSSPPAIYCGGRVF